jgi:phycocyanobilin:ferredoxin oxidoreductase
MESNRAIPDWGRAIFSDLCVIVRPESAEELERFLLYTIALNHVHILLSKQAQPVTQGRCATPEVLHASGFSAAAHSKSNARCGREADRRLEDIRAAHDRYCQKQMENSKTSAVLQAAFNEDFARRYMSEVMFDAPPAVAC